MNTATVGSLAGRIAFDALPGLSLDEDWIVQHLGARADQRDWWATVRPDHRGR